MRTKGFRRAFWTIVVGMCIWAGCGDSPTSPEAVDSQAVDPEAILQEELARSGLTASWYRGCILEHFREHLPTYRGKSFAFILADIRAIILFCRDAEGPEPPDGALEVTTTTTGDDVDGDGYTLTVDGGTPEAIGVNAVVTKSDLAPGDHQVELGGVAANCSVTGDNPRTVNVASGATTQTTFSVTCEELPPDTGDLRVVTATEGEDLDADGYTVSVGGGGPDAIGVNDSLDYPGLTAGSYSVELSGVAANCTVDGDNPRMVDVTAGATAETTFDVTCSELPPTTGDLRVVTATAGEDLDGDGYAVSVGGGGPDAIGVNDSLDYPGLTAGSYSVELSGVAANCTVDGDNPRMVDVTAGTTAETTFDVTCSELPPTTGALRVVTATTGEDIDADGYTVSVDGGTPDAIGVDDSLDYPDLAPDDYEVELSGLADNCSVDGDNPLTVAVTAGATAEATFDVTCSALPDQIVFSRSGSGLWIMDEDGSNQDQLTSGSNDSQADVSSDGQKIVFTDNATISNIWTADIDGTNLQQVTSSTTTGEFNFDPEFSPDGSKIAFHSNRSGTSQIWVMDADGTDALQLTTLGDNGNPSWSPDGSQIVFVSTRDGNAEIYVMDADGDNQTRITSNTVQDRFPHFSPDGAKIAFDSFRSGTFDIYVMDADGTDQTRLTTDSATDTRPQWSPDGESIAFTSDRGANQTIWVMNADGTDQTDASQTGTDSFATWVP